MSELLFYSKTVPLNRQTHARARLLPVAGDYSFAATVNSVPLAGKEYPILFSETHDHFRITETFAERLGRLSLLTPYAARFDLASGESFTLGRFLIVDEKKLLLLDGGTVLELCRSGQLAWIYLHLASLANLGPLLDLAAEKSIDKEQRKYF